MDKDCKKCMHSHDCKGIYSKMSKSTVDSVAIRVVIAFLLPMIVFISSMAILSNQSFININNTLIADMVYVLISATVAFVTALTAKAIHKRFQRKQFSNTEGSKNQD